MRVLRKLPIYLALFATMSFMCVAYAADSPNLSEFFKGEWQSGVPVYDGLVNENTGNAWRDYIADIEAVVVTPNTGSYESIGILHSSVEQLNIPFDDVKYIRYYYYIESPKPYTGRAKLVFPQKDFTVTRDSCVYSMEELVVGRWAYLTFDVEDFLFGQRHKGSTLPAFEFYPFGDTPCRELPDNIKIGFFRMFIQGSNSSLTNSAISAGNLVQKYPVYFEKGRADAVGETQMIFARVGESIILPECTFTRKGYRFTGWICSVGAVIYQPGDTYSIKERSINGGQHVTARTDFIANWESTNPAESEALPYTVASYVKYWGGLVKPAAQNYQYSYATVYKDYIFENATTLRLAFNPKSSDANQVVNLDGYAWSNLPLDIKKYKCLMVPYYFMTDRTTEKLNFEKPLFLFLTSGSNKTLSKIATIPSKTSLVANSWGFMIFEFDFFGDEELYACVNPSRLSDIINQCHFKPFGDDAKAKCSVLHEGDELYLGNFVFLTEIPSGNPAIEYSFVNGYEDGNFYPKKSITNAEAAVMLARAIGIPENDKDSDETNYADLVGSQYDWCRGYIYGLEKRGILKSRKGDKLNPDDYMTERDFLAAIIGARTVKDGESVSDSAGNTLVKGSERYVSREKAVVSIYTLLRESRGALRLPENTYSAYDDVSSSSPFINEIAMASYSLVRFDTGKGGRDERINSLFVQDFSATYGINKRLVDEGDAYLASLDELTSNRIAEIRASESQYKLRDGGKIYYLSSTKGSTSNSGLDERKPRLIKTLEEVNNLTLNAGDVVLFRRGDTFRGKFNTVSGVTYSAFGSGAKPILMRSPEDGASPDKWVLHYSDDSGKKIWKYYDESLKDIGAVNLISEDGAHMVAYKEVPDFWDGVYYVRGRKPGENSSVPEGQLYDYIENLNRDLEFFHKADSILKRYIHTVKKVENVVPDLANATGPLYLRCDAGNPGEIYSRIEFNLRENLVNVGGTVDVTVDNLCLMYFGAHGVGAGNTRNLVVTNCELGYGGGTIQHYNESHTNGGCVTRYGNGIEIYGGLVNYTIDNCYVYEMYDAGITHQISGSSSGNYYMEGVYYTNNVIERCIYNIEYFMHTNTGKDSNGNIPLQERYMKDVYFIGNICRMAGYGWGVQRPDSNAPSNISGWNMHNLCHNYVIENNIFDRNVDLRSNLSDPLARTGSEYDSSTPFYKNNIFVQVPGRNIISTGKKTYRCNIESEKYLQSVGGVGNKCYFVSDDREKYIDRVIG